MGHTWLSDWSHTETCPLLSVSSAISLTLSILLFKYTVAHSSGAASPSPPPPGTYLCSSSFTTPEMCERNESNKTNTIKFMSLSVKQTHTHTHRKGKKPSNWGWWFESKQSPLAPMFEFLIPSWNCLGRIRRSGLVEEGMLLLVAGFEISKA